MGEAKDVAKCPAGHEHALATKNLSVALILRSNDSDLGSLEGGLCFKGCLLHPNFTWVLDPWRREERVLVGLSV